MWYATAISVLWIGQSVAWLVEAVSWVVGAAGGGQLALRMGAAGTLTVSSSLCLAAIRMLQGTKLLNRAARDEPAPPIGKVEVTS